MLLDLRSTDWTGKDAEDRLHEVKVTTNKNGIPFDERPPTVTSGLRLGSPAVTMRGFDEEDMTETARDRRRLASQGCRSRRTRARSERPLREAASLPRLPGLLHVRGLVPRLRSACVRSGVRSTVVCGGRSMVAAS